MARSELVIVRSKTMQVVTALMKIMKFLIMEGLYHSTAQAHDQSQTGAVPFPVLIGHILIDAVPNPVPISLTHFTDPGQGQIQPDEVPSPVPIGPVRPEVVPSPVPISLGPPPVSIDLELGQMGKSPQSLVPVSTPMAEQPPVPVSSSVFVSPCAMNNSFVPLLTEARDIDPFPKVVSESSHSELSLIQPPS
jgi:hypothetical protein